MDDVDVATNRQEQLDRLALASVAFAASNIENGHQGECDKCGDDHPRLMGTAFFKGKHLPRVADGIIDGICPRCRDKFKLP